MSDTGIQSLKSVWSNMLERCRNPNRADYQWYGARGVAVCERWHVLANFAADMGNRPEGYQLDRIDNTKGYSPENCRWASASENANNRRTSRNFTINGVTKTFAEWIKQSNVKPSTAQQRFYVYGWPIERALGMEATV